MEIFCKTGQINIDGLVRSYGSQKLTFYKMLPKMGPPESEVFEWPNEDYTWEKEYGNLLISIADNKEPNGNLYDALESIKIVYKLYEWDKEFKKKK